mmetsp:Transcript_14706/g.35493  ORF Transcript_14706/g.35493 Transcript_14706/m.35493 type:complete len:256 (+) Transcript_14706:251-1018(+)
MGVCTAAPDRTSSKRRSCEGKDKVTTTGSIGARVCGLRVYQVDTEDYMMLDKHWGKQLTFEEFGPGIEKYFFNGRRTRRKVAGRFKEELAPILTLMKEQCRYKFYASSILLIYEGLDDGEECDGESRIDCRMIDFAHVFPSEKADESYICGLENFSKLLGAIADGVDIKETVPYRSHRGERSLHEHCRCAQWSENMETTKAVGTRRENGAGAEAPPPSSSSESTSNRPPLPTDTASLVFPLSNSPSCDDLPYVAE